MYVKRWVRWATSGGLFPNMVVCSWQTRGADACTLLDEVWLCLGDHLVAKSFAIAKPVCSSCYHCSFLFRYRNGIVILINMILLIILVYLVVFSLAALPASLCDLGETLRYIGMPWRIVM